MSWVPSSAFQIINTCSSGVQAIATYYNSPDSIDQLNIPMDPLSLIYSLAALNFLPAGVKGTLRPNGQVIWDSRNSVVLGSASFEKQGFDRSWNGDYSSRKIIVLWPNTIKKGNLWYNPHKAHIPFDVESHISLKINRKSLDELTKVYSEELDTATRQNCPEAKELAFKNLTSHLKSIAVLEMEARIHLEKKLKKQKQIYDIFSYAIEGIKKIAETYSSTDTKEDTVLKERLERCEESIRSGLKRPEDPPEENSYNPHLVKKLKKIWDNESIDQIHKYFLKLIELQKSPGLMEKEHSTNILRAIEAIENEKCSEFSRIYEKYRAI